MLQPQKELCLEECQNEALDYELASDARLSSAARRRDNLNLLSQNLAACRRFVLALSRSGRALARGGGPSMAGRQ